MQALCVDDKRKRLILFSDESNPRVAALIQGDVQATVPDVNVIVARPTTIDLGALVRGFFENAAGASISITDLTKLADSFNKLSQSEKDQLLRQPNFAVVSSVANAIKNAPLPVWSYIASLALLKERRLA